MADFTPTKSQKAAIETTGRAVLVSAAAGSGKTKVLTERLIKRISDDADIDSFLIITFTKAAAAELRSRITDEIGARLSDGPSNLRLRRQSALCQKAQIGTIHSFCQSFLRENCHAAGLSPEFKVIEEDRAEAIKMRVISKVMDKAYENPTADFLLLADTVGRGRDDIRLTSVVLDLHSKMQSHARPEAWAQRQIELLFRDCDDAIDTPWGAEIMADAKMRAAYWARTMESLSAKAYTHEKIGKAYGESLDGTALSLRDFARALDEGWDRAREFLPIEFPSLKRLAKSPDPMLSDHIKAVREKCKTAAKGFDKAFGADSAKLIEDMRKTAPAMKALLELTLEFDRAYCAEKRRRAEVDFSDLEHLTAQLLTDDDGAPTALAKDYSRRYTEIMVDEYQDVNRVQDTIFSAVSKNGTNLFMVGDVKQSIYRFRLADPTIFTEKYLSFADLDTASDGEPVRIMLQENFRSRREVIDGANTVFKTVMSSKLGEIDYDENAELKCGASYEGSVPVPEIMLVDLLDYEDEDDSPDKVTAEAQAVARRINELFAEGTMVTDHGALRPLRYDDIAILMRSANVSGEVYRRELLKQDIPVLGGESGSFFQTIEVSALTCLLAVVDNPHQDVPLIAALRSPLFGFTPDELSEIRATDKKSDFYTALCESESAKCRQFNEKLRILRSAAPDLELGELLMLIYDELDAVAIFSAMADGAARADNIMKLLDYAKRFEQTGFKGLHRFLDFLQKLGERGDEPTRGTGGNAVQIMTVHKSKGLEFPVVFLCNTNRKFNRQDMLKTVLVHPSLGLGPKVSDRARGIEYNCLARNAIALRLDREMLSEEMRLLYVALTRAKERLFVTAGWEEPQANLQKLALGAEFPIAPELLMGVPSMMYWVVYPYLADNDDKLSVRFFAAQSSAEHEVSEPEKVKALSDPKLVEKLRAKLSFSYAHAAAQALPSKVTATELKHLEATPDDEEALSIAPRRLHSFRKPDFSRDEKKLTGAQKGTATHMVLQYIDYAKATTLDGIKAEIHRLEENAFISAKQAEAVNASAILRLFESDLGKRILSADKLTREFKFSLLCDAERFFAGGEGEKVLLQGVIDCLMEENGALTVVDYKTDAVRGEELKARAESYASQVRAYAIAAERMTGKPVRECVLYFLHTGEAVSIKCE